MSRSSGHSYLSFALLIRVFKQHRQTNGSHKQKRRGVATLLNFRGRADQAQRSVSFRLLRRNDDCETYIWFRISCLR